MNANSSSAEENIKEEMQRVLHSIHFQNAPTMREFLEFVVTETIAGRDGQLKAYTIATEAFGRNSCFDPVTDTIVRTTAGRVRKALEAYNKECGSASPVVIRLPKGRYVPAFEFLNIPPAPRRKPSGQLFFIRRSFTRSGIIRIAGVVALLAIGLMTFAIREPRQKPISASVILDIHPVEYADEDTRILARVIDIRLSSALAQIGLAKIIPPFMPYSANEDAADTNDNVFILHSNIVDGENPQWYWQLISAKSGNLVRASREQLSSTNPVSLDQTVSMVAFEILGENGAVSAAFEQSPFSTHTCLSRSQLFHTVEMTEMYPGMRACLERIVKKAPYNAAAWAVLSSFYTGRSHFASSGDRQERALLVKRAEQAAEKAITLAPNAYLTKTALMHLRFRQGRIAEYDALQHEIRKNYPGAMVLQLQIASCIARLGRGWEALEIFDRAQKERGADLTTWLPDMAVAYFAEGEYEQALHQISRVTSDQRIVLLLKAAIYGKLGMAEEAAPIINDIVATYPDISENFHAWLTDLSWSAPLMSDFADGLAMAGLLVERPAPLPAAIPSLLSHRE